MRIKLIFRRKKKQTNKSLILTHVIGRDILSKYKSDLTIELDKASNMYSKDSTNGHYIVVEDIIHQSDLSNLSDDDRCLYMRRPGRTVGGIYFDENRVITHILIDESCYDFDAKSICDAYVGRTLIIKQPKDKNNRHKGGDIDEN